MKFNLRTLLGGVAVATILGSEKQGGVSGRCAFDSTAATPNAWVAIEPASPPVRLEGVPAASPGEVPPGLSPSYGYEIQAREVTWAEWRAWLAADPARAPRSRDVVPPAWLRGDAGAFPVTGVHALDARSLGTEHRRGPRGTGAAVPVTVPALRARWPRRPSTLDVAAPAHVCTQRSFVASFPLYEQD